MGHGDHHRNRRWLDGLEAERRHADVAGHRSPLDQSRIAIVLSGLLHSRTVQLIRNEVKTTSVRWQDHPFAGTEIGMDEMVMSEDC